ncbi:MAG: Beta-barrel assembly-enhancing protease [Candidatus Heimdallarchaeota archaeon LC_3]|nr:MAG: Beta-barrel assembly-enhancing protease [Candidatus Heimdallarchaeota archaeon LC_3]
MTRYSPTQIIKAIKSADSAFKSKDYQKAIVRYKKSASMDPKQPLIWFRLGISYYYSGNLLEAIRSYERAFEIEKHYEIAINLGLSFLGLKKYDDAEKSFNQAIHLDKSPKNSRIKAEIYFQIGRTLHAKGDLKKSLKMLDKSESCENPPILLINYFRGENYLSQNKLDESISFYKKTLEINENFKDAVIKLVLIYLDTEDKENALKLLTSFIKKNQKSSDLWSIRGDIHNSMNDYVNALFAFNQAIKFAESDKDDLSARIGKIKNLLIQKKFEEAENEIDTFLDKHPKNIDGLVLKAESLWLQNMREKAIQYFEENVIFYYPENKAAQLKLAEYYLQVKNYTEAAPKLEKLLETHPEDFNINLNLGQIYSEENYFDSVKSKEYLDKALVSAKKEKEFSHVYFTYGKLDYKNENYKDAENNFKKSLKIDKTNIYAGLFLSKTYLKIDNKERLELFLTQFFESNPSYKEIFKTDVDLNQFIIENEK